MVLVASLWLLSGVCLPSGPSRLDAAASAAGAPSHLHSQVQKEILAHLQDSLWPFWIEHSPDLQDGGFLVDLDRDGSVHDGRKSLVSQARQVWAFSRMWNAGHHDPRIRQAALSGIDFLRRHFWDDTYDGWFAEVSREGAFTSTAKDPYGFAFVIYAGVECYRAFGEPLALNMAKRTFDTLERHAKDPDNPGYFGAMDRRWTQSGAGVGTGHKTMNTQLHLLEAFAELARTTGDPLHLKRTRELLDIVTDKIYMPQYGACVDAFNNDWSPATDRWAAQDNADTSYGHDVEMAWLIQRAAEVLKLPPERYRAIGLKLIDTAMKYGWDGQAGALCSRGPLLGPATDRTMVWWVQAEDLTALDWAWRTTGEQRYLDALQRQADWLLHKQSDPLYGGWWDTVAPDGRVLVPQKAHVWHLAYHEVRACLNVGTGNWAPGAEAQ